MNGGIKIIFRYKMRISIGLLFMCLSTVGYPQENKVIPKRALEAHASFSLNSNGFAPIPSFSLDKPALIASVNMIKGRFSYDPSFGYSLEMKPWFLDQWFHYRIIDRARFELKTGINFSTFCSGITVNDREILKAERYFAYAIFGTYKFSPLSSLMLEYWSDNGQEPGTLKGHYINLTYDRSNMNLGEKLLLSINLKLFYINYTGNNDGIFVSPTISLSVREIPAALFFQSTQALQSNISPWPGFKWNVGLSYDL
jgi:hypothetical protein